jgi:hypothetical protein
MSMDEQYSKFYDNIETLLEELTCLSCDSYVFLDANINLLQILNNGHARNYANSVLNNGFIFTNFKVTRVQNQTSSLIDYILTNRRSNSFHSGSIIDDVSDHWMTYIQPSLKKRKTIKKGHPKAACQCRKS